MYCNLKAARRREIVLGFNYAPAYKFNNSAASAYQISLQSGNTLLSY